MNRPGARIEIEIPMTQVLQWMNKFPSFGILREIAIALTPIGQCPPLTPVSSFLPEYVNQGSVNYQSKAGSQSRKDRI